MPIEVDGLDEFLRAMRQTPREFSSEMRKASKRIVGPVAEEAKFHALSSGRPQMIAMASTIKAKSDRLPMVMGGGARSVTSSGAPARAFYRGASFGRFGARSESYRQFPPAVKGGSAIYPAIEGQGENIRDEFAEAVRVLFMNYDRVVRF